MTNKDKAIEAKAKFEAANEMILELLKGRLKAPFKMKFSVIGKNLIGGINVVIEKLRKI